MEWARKHSIRLAYIQPGKPQQNAYVERFNRTVRHEYLEMNEFRTIEEARRLAEQWLWTYNNERPNMAIGGITPAMKFRQIENKKDSHHDPAKNGGITEALEKGLWTGALPLSGRCKSAPWQDQWRS